MDYSAFSSASSALGGASSAVAASSPAPSAGALLRRQLPRPELPRRRLLRPELRSAVGFGRRLPRRARFGGSLFGQPELPRRQLPRPAASSAALLGRARRLGRQLPRRRRPRPELRRQLPRPTASSAASFLGRSRRSGGLAALAASSASAALVARSSTRSLAFSPGSAFFGLLRAARSLMPAASRKRSTRSDGWAPTDSQCEMRSASSFTRSGESFASSGL